MDPHNSPMGRSQTEREFLISIYSKVESTQQILNQLILWQKETSATLGQLMIFQERVSASLENLRAADAESRRGLDLARSTGDASSKEAGLAIRMASGARIKAGEVHHALLDDGGVKDAVERLVTLINGVKDQGGMVAQLVKLSAQVESLQDQINKWRSWFQLMLFVVAPIGAVLFGVAGDWIKSLIIP